MRVLIGYEFSGIVREAFAARGHDAYSCDRLPTEKPGKHYECDISEVVYLGWDLAIFHPPCTYLTVSGSRWIYEQEGRRELRDRAVAEVKWLADLPINKIGIENPVGRLSTLWRKPNQIIQPYQFGHPETKKTCLWLKNLPELQPTSILKRGPCSVCHGRVSIVDGCEHCKETGLEPWKARVHHEPPSPDRWKNRSRTLTGIAEAMAMQWGNS